MKRVMMAVLVVCLPLAAGCSMHQRRAPEALETRVSDLVSETDAGSRPVVDWWLQFQDEALNGLVDRALTENPTIDRAAAGVRKAEAFLSGQKAAELPGVNLAGSAGRARTTGVMGGISDSWNLSAVASYELDLWGRRRALTNQRRLDRDAALAALASARVSVSAQVADTWYLLVERRIQQRLAEERVAMRRERRELVERRYAQGTVAAQEVYGARAELAVEEASLAGYRADAEVADHALAALLNRKAGNLGDPLPEIPLDPFPPTSPLGDQPLSSRLILGRPDMVQAMTQVKRADEAVAVALADRFPSFGLTAGYGRASYESGGISGSGPVWSVGGNLLAPLLDWGARRASVTANRAAFDESLAGFRTTALLAFREADDALSRYHHGETAVARFEAALEAASANSDFVKNRYLQGASDYQALLMARLSENEARGRLIANRRLLFSHRIGLARALGGSFSDRWSKS